MLFLTDNEKKVLGLIAQGLTDKEIAARLYLSPRTIHSYVRNILAKMEVNNRVQAVVKALKWGLIEA